MYRHLLLLFALLLFSCGDKGSRSAVSGKSTRGPSLERAAGLLKRGLYQEGLEMLTRMRRSHTKDKEFWNLYGLAMRYNAYLEGDEEMRQEELKGFRRALALDPNYAEARFNLANALWELRKREEAVALYRELIATKAPQALQSQVRVDAFQARLKKQKEAAAQRAAAKRARKQAPMGTVPTPLPTGGPPLSGPGGMVSAQPSREGAPAPVPKGPAPTPAAMGAVPARTPALPRAMGRTLSRVGAMGTALPTVRGGPRGDARVPNGGMSGAHPGGAMR